MSTRNFLPELKKQNSRCLEIWLYPINHASYVITGFVITDKSIPEIQAFTQLFYSHAYSKERFASFLERACIIFYAVLEIMSAIKAALEMCKF